MESDNFDFPSQEDVLENQAEEIETHRAHMAQICRDVGHHRLDQYGICDVCGKLLDNNEE